MTRQFRTRLALVLTVSLAVAIGFATLTPQQQMPSTPSGTDKLAHVIAFAALVAPAVALRPRLIWWLVPGALVYGGLIELIQPMVGRGAETADFVADALGALFGAGLGWWINRRFVAPRAARDAARDAAGPPG